jgi:hypothetical protein
MNLRVAALILVVGATYASAKPAGTTYVSPDQQLRAVVIPAKPGGSTETCLVDIYKADGALTDREGHSGSNPEVLSASWSPDSRFFVYTVVRRTGLHRSRPLVMAYVRESEYRFYDVSDYVGGAIADSKWAFRGPSYLRGRLIGRSGSVRAFEFDLSKIRWEKKT